MQTEHITLPAGSPGTQSKLTVWRYGQPGGKKVYIQAALHADEWPGLLMLHHLHKHLTNSTIIGEIVVLPYANPLGMRQFLGGYQLGRFDFDYSGNFNRGYLDLGTSALPFLTREALINLSDEDKIATVRQAMAQALDDWQPQLESEHLRKALQRLSFDADFVIDVHCDANACAHAFVNVRHQQTGEALAQIMQLDALILEDDPGSIAFDEAACSPWWKIAKALDVTLPYPTFATTLELRGERDVSDAIASQDAAHLMHFLAHIGVIEGDKPTTSSTCIGTPLAGVARVLAPHSGLIDFKVSAGDRVAAGALVAELVDLDDPDAARTPLHAPTEGVIYALGRNHLVRPGHVVVQIAGKERLGDGKLAY